MQRRGIQTAQTILIDYEVAGLGERIGAFLIDWLIQAFYVAVLFYVNFEIETLPVWLNLLLALPVMVYHLFFEMMLDGQSPGKRQLKIKVVRLDGTTPRFKQYGLRWILRPVDIWISGSVAVLSILISVRGQRLGDKAAGTTVVRYSSLVFDNQKAASAGGTAGLDSPSFPQVAHLKEEDVSLIREALQTYRRTADPQDVHLMAEKMEEELAVKTNMPPVEFLNVILEDYQILRAQERREKKW